MNQAAEFVEAALLEPVVDDVDGRPLFADEEHALAADDEIGNQICDGLRFAGARRALDDVAGTAAGQGDRLRLRRIAGDDVEPLGQRQRFSRIGADLARGDGKGRLERRILGRLVGQLAIIADERHAAITQIRQRHRAEIEFPVERIVVPLFAELIELPLGFGYRRIVFLSARGGAVGVGLASVFCCHVAAPYIAAAAGRPR